jgi:DNA polymerase III sliding clamp (beta) subunit (PCNA family)
VSEIPVKPLADALQAVSKFAVGRTSIPVYQKVAIESKDGQLVVGAHNACGSISISTAIPYAEQRAVVEHSALHRAIARASTGAVELDANPSSLRIQIGSMELIIPSENIELTRPTEAPTSVSIDAKKASKCAGKLVTMEVDVELAIAQGQRLLAEDGFLYFLASNSHGMAGAYTECNGGEIDAVVLHKSITAIGHAVSVCGGDKLSLGVVDNRVVFTSGGVHATVPTIGGKLPARHASFNATVTKAVQWKVARGDLLEFLQQVAVFATPEATAVTLEPVRGGLHVLFDAINNDGTPSLSAGGKCSALIPGECSGEPARISHTYLRHLLSNCSDDYKLYRGERAILVESENYFAGYARMGDRT